MSKLRVALLTAGLSSGDFELAGDRIMKAAPQLFEFKLVISLSKGNLAEYCPEVSKKYGQYLNESVPGFGFWSWKPELIYRVAQGKFGNVDQVVWIDSGCEINSNFISRRTFKGRVEHASQRGYWLHALNNSELEYSKKSVINQFPDLAEFQLREAQIQANYMHFSSRLAIESLAEWFEIAKQKIENLDFSTEGQEHQNFVTHKSDQSTLSLVLKRHRVYANRFNLPNGHSSKSVLRGLVEPIWIARNRSGESIMPKWVRKLP